MHFKIKLEAPMARALSPCALRVYKQFKRCPKCKPHGALDATAAVPPQGLVLFALPTAGTVPAVKL